MQARIVIDDVSIEELLEYFSELQFHEETPNLHMHQQAGPPPFPYQSRSTMQGQRQPNYPPRQQQRPPIAPNFGQHMPNRPHLIPNQGYANGRPQNHPNNFNQRNRPYQQPPSRFNPAQCQQMNRETNINRRHILRTYNNLQNQHNTNNGRNVSFMLDNQ